MRAILKKLYDEPMYRNSFSLIINSAAGAIFGLIFWIVAARTMPSADVGVATAITSAISLLITVAGFGMDTGLMRFIPKAQDRSGLYTAVIAVTTGLSVLLAIVFLLFQGLLSPGLSALWDSWMPLLFLVYVALMSICIMQNATFVALRKGELLLIQNLILGLRIVPMLFIASLGVESVLISCDIAYAASAAFGAWMLYRSGVGIRAGLEKRSLEDTVKFSLGNYPLSIFTLAPTTVMPLMIISTIGAAESAYYYIAYSIASFLFFIPAAISAALLVEGSYEIPLGDSLAKALKLMAVLMVPSILVIFFFGDKVLLIFNKEYSTGAFELLRLLAIASLFASAMSVYIAIKRVQKDLRTINLLVIAVAVTILVSSYVGLVEFGLNGLGYAWVFTYIVICPLILWLTIREWGADIRQYMGSLIRRTG